MDLNKIPIEPEIIKRLYAIVEFYEKLGIPELMRPMIYEKAKWSLEKTKEWDFIQTWQLKYDSDDEIDPIRIYVDFHRECNPKAFRVRYTIISLTFAGHGCITALNKLDIVMYSKSFSEIVEERPAK